MRTSVAMTREIVVVAPEVSLKAATRMMKRLHVRHLPVVSAGRLLGILSDRDLLERREADVSITCGEAMTPAPITCSPDTSVSRVAALMLEHKIDSVPVVEGGQLVGLVTSSDLLELLVERDQAQVLPIDFRLRLTQSDGALDAVA
jgi:acetoin utilization protein AcuB